MLFRTSLRPSGLSGIPYEQIIHEDGGSGEFSESTYNLIQVKQDAVDRPMLWGLDSGGGGIDYALSIPSVSYAYSSAANLVGLQFDLTTFTTENLNFAYGNKIRNTKNNYEYEGECLKWK